MECSVQRLLEVKNGFKAEAELKIEFFRRLLQALGLKLTGVSRPPEMRHGTTSSWTGKTPGLEVEVRLARCELEVQISSGWETARKDMVTKPVNEVSDVKSIKNRMTIG